MVFSDNDCLYGTPEINLKIIMLCSKPVILGKGYGFEKIHIYCMYF